MKVLPHLYVQINSGKWYDIATKVVLTGANSVFLSLIYFINIFELKSYLTSLIEFDFIS